MELNKGMGIRISIFRGLKLEKLLHMFQGVLRKMHTEATSPVGYFLELDGDFIALHQCLDKQLEIEVVGTQCLHCGLQKPIFRQGFCQSCFFEIPQAADWVMHPELSKAHLGIEDRDLNYEKKVQLQPHIVYLALSSHLKVGVTRKSQVPTRWIDQGAHEAMPLIEVPNRYLAGVGEVALKERFSDKTNWRKMLQNQHEAVDWKAVHEEALSALPEALKSYTVEADTPFSIAYPVLHYPEKVNSINFSKVNQYSGKLKGIKGQYLIFEDQSVCNIRSNEGYVVQIQVQ